MVKQRIIQKASVFLLLIIFLISTTPKAFIHNAIADHRDYDFGCNHKTHTSPCLTAAGFNCHFVNLVVDVPYLYTAQPLFTSINSSFLLLEDHTYYSIFQSGFFSKEGRGPPCVVSLQV